eukprot:CAMPEP_0184985598 /NCGR_PEP_ID=MMETSP1098-20130426/14200_1 /TAXON_ID=89044 /ORGANISM="Spumella elongata, Strain CCAP 955/1" /LENGTH=353 /DNA_ID=CAMNT_0027509691 /DNA_START=202 /DNA_END=1263 /DNA_ORIENTATION=-
MLCTSKEVKDGDKIEVDKDKKQHEAASHVHPPEHTDPQEKPSVPDEHSPAHPRQETLVQAASHLTHSVQHNIASTLQFTQQRYDEFEKILMERIHDKNQKRVRMYVLSFVVFITWVSIVFGARMRKYFTEQTAGLAKETLENESLKIQTQELATAVVQTILEDKDITNHAATFLKEASTAPETQQALLKLTMHILQHKDTLEELTKMSQKLIKNLANDKESIADLAQMFTKVLQDPALRTAMVTLIGDLCQDKEVFESVSGLVVQLAGEPKVTESTSALLTGSISDLMHDDEISHQSRQFIADVVGDDLLQKEGGYALWNSIQYALKPGIIRVTGVTLVVVSAGLAKLMLSPY